MFPKLREVAKTSEFWLGLAGIIMVGAKEIGWMDPAVYDKLFYPVLTYVIGRITSKAVKD